MDPALPDDDQPGSDRPGGDRPTATDSGGSDPGGAGSGGLDPGVVESGGAGSGARRPGRALAVGAAVVLGLTLLGAPLGLLWAGLAPDVPVIKTAEGAVLAQPQPEEFIAADGWFSFLGIGFGILVALGIWAALPRWRGPGGMLIAVGGALGAALVAWGLGRELGIDDYRQRLAEAPIGQSLTKPADLRAGGFEWLFEVIPTLQGVLLLGAFAAAVTYTLLAGWSSHPDLVPGPAEPSGQAWPVGPDPTAPPPDGGPAEPGGGPAEGLSSDSTGTPGPPESPAPPGSGEAGPPRG